MSRLLAQMAARAKGGEFGLAPRPRYRFSDRPAHPPDAEPRRLDLELGSRHSLARQGKTALPGESHVEALGSAVGPATTRPARTVSDLAIDPDATRGHATGMEATHEQHLRQEVGTEVLAGRPDERRRKLVSTALAKPASTRSQGEKIAVLTSSGPPEPRGHNAALFARVEEADVAQSRSLKAARHNASRADPNHLALSERRPGRALNVRALAAEWAGDDQPTVTVHIGRIDVRAMHSPAQSGSAGSQKSGLRRPSLDAYLQGRERGRS